MAIVGLVADASYGAAHMPSEDPNDLFERMRARVRAGGGARSKLSVWMAEREQQIAKLIADCGADWDGWAEDFIKDGLMQAPAGWGQEGPDGAAARRRAAETARMTWARLRKRRGAVKSGGKAKAVSVTPEVRTEPRPAEGGSAAERHLRNLENEHKDRSR